MNEAPRDEAPILSPAPARPIEPLPAPPNFSIVIPVHQAADTVSEAIETALTQVPTAYEVIVSDDGSTDDLEATLNPFAGQIEVVRHPHGGVAAARNAGWRAASGDFVLFADADDNLLPGKLAALGRLGQVRPDLDLLCTDMYFERDGERAGRFGEANPFPLENQRLAIFERCFVVQPAYRRTRLIEVGGFDQGLRTGEDWDCVLRLILTGSAAGLWDEPLATYRIHPGSLTHSRPETLRDRVRIMEKAARLPGLSPEERAAAAQALAAQQGRAKLAAAQAAIAARRPDARRRSFELARTRGVDAKLRLWALAIAVLPPSLQRRVAARLGGSSQLSRLLPSNRPTRS